MTALLLVLLAAPSLVPNQPSTAPDYFCTWNLQGYVTNYTGADRQADALTEANLFGHGPSQNWVEFFPDARADLYLVLDDTWDIPVGGGRGHPLRGSLELDLGRFPSYVGTPAERLAKLNRDVRAHGWRGLGLWVCSARAKARRDRAVSDEQYWTERLRWSADAGIEYWKVDWGAMTPAQLAQLNEWAHRTAPHLWIEHGGVNREGRTWLAGRIDVIRTYDVAVAAAIPETIWRVAQLLRYPPEQPAARTLINCEDEPYIGAALGCVYGVMRHPLVGPLPNGQPDKWFSPTFRDLKHRLDEVTRAVRWHRLAAPLPLGEHEAIDPTLLKESAKHNGSPARLARGGLPLPTVSVPGGGEPPYVLACRHPGGEVSLATIGRRRGPSVTIPLADVTVEAGTLERPVGIFGEYASLTLRTTARLADRRVLAQDLAGATPVDITAEVKLVDGQLTLPGTVLHRVGLMAAHRGELSDPGLVLVVQ